MQEEVLKMICHKIRSVLSTYIDGELQPQDVSLVEDHIAGCVSCAHELEQIRCLTTRLSTVTEVEPPAFLLAQIEAATVSRPTVIAKMRMLLDQLRVPQHGVRWAVSTVAAIVIAAAVIVSQTGTSPKTNNVVRTPPPVVHMAKQSAEIAVQPTVVEKPTAEKQSVSPQKPAEQTVSTDNHRRIRHKRSIAKHSTRRPAIHVASQPQVKGSDGIGNGRKMLTFDRRLNYPAPTEQRTLADKTVTSPSSADVAAEVKTIVASALDVARNSKPSDYSDSIEHLRSVIAARNRERNYETNTGTVEGDKYSVGIASIRF